MTRALTGTALAVALLLTAADGWATPVYWIPAHDLVPELLGGYLTWGDLDADGDDDVLEYAATVHWNTGCPESTTWESEGGF